MFKMCIALQEFVSTFISLIVLDLHNNPHELCNYSHFTKKSKVQDQQKEVMMMMMMITAL